VFSKPPPDIGLPIIAMMVVIVLSMLATMLINAHVDHRRCGELGGTIHRSEQVGVGNVKCVIAEFPVK
jgi:hypothetical protein